MLVQLQAKLGATHELGEPVMFSRSSLRVAGSSSSRRAGLRARPDVPM
jgi:hypothetical protein